MATGFEWKNVTLPGANTKDPRLNSTGTAASGYEKALKSLTDTLGTGIDNVVETRDNRVIDAFNQEIAKAQTGQEYNALLGSDFRQRVLANQDRPLSSTQQEGIFTNLTNQKTRVDATDDRKLESIYKGATENLGQYKSGKGLTDALSTAAREYGATSDDISALATKGETAYFDYRNPGVFADYTKQVTKGDFSNKLKEEAFKSAVNVDPLLSETQKTSLIARMADRNAAVDESIQTKVYEGIRDSDTSGNRKEYLEDIEGRLDKLNMNAEDRAKWMQSATDLYNNDRKEMWTETVNSSITPEGSKQYLSSEEMVDGVSQKLREQGATEDQISLLTEGIVDRWNKNVGPSAGEQKILTAVGNANAQTSALDTRQARDDAIGTLKEAGVLPVGYQDWYLSSEGDEVTTAQPLEAIKSMEKLLGSDAGPAVQYVINRAGENNAILNTTQLNNILGMSMQTNWTPGDGNFDFDMWNDGSKSIADKMVGEIAQLQRNPSTMANIQQLQNDIENEGKARLESINSENMRKQISYNVGQSKENLLTSDNPNARFSRLNIRNNYGRQQVIDFLTKLEASGDKTFASNEKYKTFMGNVADENTLKLLAAQKIADEENGIIRDVPPEDQHNFPLKSEANPDNKDPVKDAFNAYLEVKNERAIPGKRGANNNPAYLDPTPEQTAAENKLWAGYEKTIETTNIKEDIASTKKRIELYKDSKNSRQKARYNSAVQGLKDLQKKLLELDNQ